VKSTWILDFRDHNFRRWSNRRSTQNWLDLGWSLSRLIDLLLMLLLILFLLFIDGCLILLSLLVNITYVLLSRDNTISVVHVLCWEIRSTRILAELVHVNQRCTLVWILKLMLCRILVLLIQVISILWIIWEGINLLLLWEYLMAGGMLNMRPFCSIPKLESTTCLLLFLWLIHFFEIRLFLLFVCFCLRFFFN